MAETISFNVPTVEITEDDQKTLHEQNSQLLADALARMDGLIGDYRPPSELIEVSLVNDPVVRAIVEQAALLSEKMNSWDETRGEEVKGHPKDLIPVNTRETIVTWLSSKRQSSTVELERLREDKSELLKQVVSLQQQLEALNNDREKLSSKVVDLECRVIEKEEHIRSLSEELRLTKATLHTKEVEVRQLHSEIKAGLQAPPTGNGKQRRVTIDAPPQSDKHTNGPTRKSSFRALARKFKKKAKAASVEEVQDTSSPVKPVNSRASAFYSLSCEGVCEWFSSIGLDVYGDLVTQNLLTGEALAGMVSRQGNIDFVRMGIVSTLHCKKLRLAVEDALREFPSSVGGLDHNWVGQWLCDIGLPQYQRTFQDARFDGRMLNVITMDDLNLLEVNTPFHVVSIQRAIQALRMCGYNGGYMKNSSSGRSHGSNKLLHWSAGDVEEWVRGIELDGYVGGLSGTGIHGAVMMLDVQFTTDSLARVLGVTPAKTLIRTHLSRKFMELIGPIASQDKLDAMQSKSFVPLDPTEVAKGRKRSRSLGSRRGRQPVPEVMLCPFDKFPETVSYSYPSAAAGSILASPTSTQSSYSDHSLPQRPPTPL